VRDLEGPDAGGAPGPALREVVSAEYAPELQLRVLGLDADALPEPILDLGCGPGAALVRALRARGKDAAGIDWLAAPADGVRRASWLELPLAEGSLGTVISHLGFSLHFLHHHLRPGDEALRYARRYMEILRALRPGGLFAYAPGLPFVEAHLPATQWRVERTPVAIPRPPAPAGAPELPWYASRVVRLGARGRG
jgi:SAM-dependent methyltransferase